MPRSPWFWSVNAVPSPLARKLWAALPFLLVLALYQWFSVQRLAENDQDKVLPAFSQMADTIQRMAFEPDKRTGELTLLQDTIASLSRLAIGVSAAALVGFVLGLNFGLFPGPGALMNPFVTFASIVPPLALLPILFITFGVDELAKIMLIFIGVTPPILRDVTAHAKSIPREQIVKSLTLGAGQFQLAWRLVAPQLLPRLIEAVRLNLGAAWLFLIAAEAIASVDGLGYRIFLVRRYMAMDVIIPYVLWITALGYTVDWCFKAALSRFFPWYQR